MRSFSIVSVAVSSLALAAALSLVTACGGGASARSPADQARLDQATTASRLAGTWQLVDYRPEVPLDAMTQALLMSQIQTMQIRFDQGRILADSPTIHLSRTFQLSDVAGNLFKIIATDENGVSLTSSAQLSDDGGKLFFHGETEPWRGMGTLVRTR